MTLLATTMPSPSPLHNCHPSWRLSEILTDSCTDMMGHTVNVVLAALAWSQYTQYRIVSIIAWLISITGA